MRISKEQYEKQTVQVKQVAAFLNSQFPNLTKEQWQKSYQSWARGGNGWDRYSIGGTYINGALAWYQHIYRPGRREWRPSIIMAAVIEAAQQEVQA
jgi:hypothetical protein